MYAYWTRTRIITFLMTFSTCPCRFISVQKAEEKAIIYKVAKCYDQLTS